MKESISDLIELYQVRKSYDQKTEFIEWMILQCEKLEYSVDVQQSKKCRNIIVGDLKTAEIIYTAHYDTPAMFLFPIVNFIGSIPMYLLSQIIISIPLFILPIFLYSYGILNLSPLLIVLGLGMFIGFSYQITYGKANPNNMNDNTSGVATLLHIMEELSVEDRDKAAFVFFDLEEAGLKGSNLFKVKYQSLIETKLLMNFDCVANGSEYLFISKKQFKSDDRFSILEDLTKKTKKTTRMKDAIRCICPSDQLLFKKSCGVVAVNKLPIIGYYLNKIHWPSDKIFQYENIEELSSIVVEFMNKLA